MKTFALLAVLLLCVNLSLQLPKLINCPADYVLPSSVANSCGTFTCEGRNKISGKGCGTYQCLPEKRMGYIEPDNSKPFPECCGGEICAE